MMRDKLVKVERGGLGFCVDGRQAGISLLGPKIQGGILGVAALGLGKGKDDIIGEDDIRAACERVRNAGFTPSVHGDKGHGKRGCGMGRLWADGQLENLPKLGVSLERVSEIVIEEGGRYVELEGGHEEQFVVINYVSDMTLEPDGTMFILDAWAAELFGIDQNRMLQNAAEVVRKLKGPALVKEIR